MLTKRIIPCLDIMKGRVVKGVNFVDLSDAGDPVTLAHHYTQSGADELVFLDIEATSGNRMANCSLVEMIARKINVPFTVGGGIRNVHDVSSLLGSGADKISVNSAAVLKPGLIEILASRFGSQCITVAIDVKKRRGRWIVHINGGKAETDREAVDWAIEAGKRGAGELLVTSMDRDGTCKGFDIPLIKSISNAVNCPVIASGGGGREEDFLEVFNKCGADAALAANIFHFKKKGLKTLKNYLYERGVPIRRV